MHLSLADDIKGHSEMQLETVLEVGNVVGQIKSA